MDSADRIIESRSGSIEERDTIGNLYSAIGQEPSESASDLSVDILKKESNDERGKDAAATLKSLAQLSSILSTESIQTGNSWSASGIRYGIQPFERHLFTDEFDSSKMTGNFIDDQSTSVPMAIDVIHEANGNCSDVDVSSQDTHVQHPGAGLWEMPSDLRHADVISDREHDNSSEKVAVSESGLGREISVLIEPNFVVPYPAAAQDDIRSPLATDPNDAEVNYDTVVDIFKKPDFDIKQSANVPAFIEEFGAVTILSPDRTSSVDGQSQDSESKDLLDSPDSQISDFENHSLRSIFQSLSHMEDKRVRFLAPTSSTPLKGVHESIPQELVDLINSFIQASDAGSLRRLQKIVSGEEAFTSPNGAIIEEDHVSSLIVGFLLDKMGATEFLADTKEFAHSKTMLSAAAAVLAGELLPFLPSRSLPGVTASSPRVRMVDGLARVLQACSRNRAMCSSAGLLQVLFSAMRTILLQKQKEQEQFDHSQLLDAVEALGSHSMTVVDLREWLKTIVAAIPIGKSLDLVLSLERVMSGEETRGPSHTFEFDGESSGLLGPSESRWPFVNGYAFATWLYIESFADTVNTAAAAAAIAAAAAAKTGKSSAMSAAAAASALAGEGTAHMPRLFSFLSADNHGVEAYFHGQFLVVESANGKGKRASMHFTHAFNSRQWYFVGLEHSYKQSLLGKSESEVRLYVDGRLYESRPLEFPRVSKALGFCCIGTNPPPAMAGLQRRRRQCPLFAEMGPIYIFKEPIGLDRMARLAARGGDALPSFGIGAGVPWFANSEQVFAAAEDSAALDMELGPRLHLLYHPKLLIGRLCPDASPSGSSGLHRKPAEVLGHVHVAARTRPSEAVWAMGEGGPMALLPLIVAAVDKETLRPVAGDIEISSTVASLSAPILRILAVAFQHPANAEEMARSYAPRVLAYLLSHLVCLPVLGEPRSTNGEQTRTEAMDEELVAAVVSLAQAPRDNFGFKVQLYSTLLLDLKLWSCCTYGLQKKLLSSLADMVNTEAVAMRGANAVQLLLDGCRRCYWVIPESDSIHVYGGGVSNRPVGELNALVDELLVVIELLVASAPVTTSGPDVCSLVQFVLDCPQPNQVARVLHLMFRLIVQPNLSRANLFAEVLLASGGVEMLLILLQREAELGEMGYAYQSSKGEVRVGTGLMTENVYAQSKTEEVTVHKSSVEDALSSTGSTLEDPVGVCHNPGQDSPTTFQPVVSAGRKSTGENLGGISLSISVDSASSNFRNVDSGDGIMVGIVSLIGALITRGFLKLTSLSSAVVLPLATSTGSTSMLGESGVGVTSGMWLMYALQKAFQAAPNRLLTNNVYSVILPAVVRSELGSLASHVLYDSGHRFEHTDLLFVLLHSLPFAPTSLQHRALQDILFLGCTLPENRTILTGMPEWPEWLLEILISNYEVGTSDGSMSLEEVQDLIYSFLFIMLEYSMRLKDGWKDVEATVHCAEWLAMVGGSSFGEQRLRREDSLPIIKRKLLGGLLDFAARELQLQTEVVATAAAGVAAEGLSPQAAKVEAEAVAQLSVSLAENALVILMLVEDHLRLQCQTQTSGLSGGGFGGMPVSPRLGGYLASPVQGSPDVGGNVGLRRSSIGSEIITFSPEKLLSKSKRHANDIEPGGVPLEVLASMADANGQISAAAMGRLTASAAAEPYESVRGALISYGSCGPELANGWNRRSRLWYGVGVTPGTTFGGGGGGWKVWMSAVECNEDGEWADHLLVKKCITMLQSLLLDDLGPGGVGIGFNGVAGTGLSAVQTLQQLLDSEQIFFVMLRMVLLGLREDDKGNYSEEYTLKSNISIERSRGSLQKLFNQSSLAGDNPQDLAIRRAKSSLLWCVLAPLITMPLVESRRQRVLVAACILYTEVWHAVGEDRRLLRKQYVELILPAFTALLRHWRPLLSGVYELTDAEGQSPLAVEDRSLATDALPAEAVLSMISPAWAATFASPPAGMALAMAAAGVTGGEAFPLKVLQAKRDVERLERKASRLLSFASFPKLPESPRPLSVPKDKASAKAASLAAARDQERNAKIGSGRGLGAVAMATSTQRRNLSDKERARRWNVLEVMNAVWLEYFDLAAETATDMTNGKEGTRLGAVLSLMVETAKYMCITEINRRAMAAAADEFGSAVGIRVWRSLIRRLTEMNSLFGPFHHQIGSSQHIFWKLDPMENSLRMRRRLRRNYKGTDHHEAAADYEDALGQVNVLAARVENAEDLSGTPLPAGAPKLAPEANVLEDIGEELTRGDLGDIDDKNNEMENLNVKFDDSVVGTMDIASAERAANMSGSLPSDAAMAAVAAAIVTEPKEKLILEIPAAMVQPLKVLRGRLQVTTRRICFMIDDRVHIDDSGVANLNAEDNPDGSEQQDADWKGQRRGGAKDRLWPLSALWEVHSRRYLLRKSALELFMVDRSNFFFNFGTADNRRSVYKALVQAKPPHLNYIYAETQRPETLLKRTQLMERWVRREISNFDYLMQLNTLAGRTYNDITQYPVFPWVLADYTSESLDLDDIKVFRDLSKPLGALNSSRLGKYLERYDNFDDPVIPKFHYGSHYSSAGTVLYYVVRVEPYSTLAIYLQGGKFDHADRMFSDISATWKGVLEDMSDVKELVPEFFYLPEIFTNHNQVNLGKTQKGETLGDVKLPRWAANPVDFVQKHRAALESEYVSTHLHHWIDLIFGFKQRGKEAIAANNVFFYMTYEGAVDIDKITDPVLRKATQDQITYFGQTPSQLLTTPHVERIPIDDVLQLQTIFRNPAATKTYGIPSPERLNVPASEISVTHNSIITIGMDAPACCVAVHRWQPNTPDGRGMPFLFQHGRSSTGSSSGAFIRMFRGQSGPIMEECTYPRAIALTKPGVHHGTLVAITPDGRNLLTGGHADNTVKVVATDTARAVESASGHCAPITCVALSPDGSILVTGSCDATAILWRIHGNAGAVAAGTNPISDPAMVAASLSPSNPENGEANLGVDGRRRRIEGPLHVLRGHLDELICCSVNADLDLVATSSRIKGVLLHSITRGRFLNKLPVFRADILAISSEGNVIVWDKVKRILYAFTMNGIFICKKELLATEGNFTSIVVSADGLRLLIAISFEKSLQTDFPFHGKRGSTLSECPICRGILGIHLKYCTLLSEDCKDQENQDLQRHQPSSTEVSPCILIVDLYSMKVAHRFTLQREQDITAMMLNQDNTNLVVSTANGQLLVFTDPVLSVKVVDQMLRLGWEGGGLSGFIT